MKRGAGMPPPVSQQGAFFDVLVKLLVIGDSGVGKSCLLLRFCDDEFTPSFIATIGLDHKSKIVQLPPPSKKRCKIQVWDTAGQEQYRSMTSNFYRSSMGVAVVFDVTYRRSFLNIPNWLKNLEQHASDQMVKILVGNKCDEEDRREVTREEAMELAVQNGMVYMETSAKANINVDKLFIELAESCLLRQQSADAPLPPNQQPVALGGDFLGRASSSCCG